jgi:hypothetical protein
MQIAPSSGTPESLDLVCKAAIRCLTPTPVGRMTTKELLATTNQAMLVHSPLNITIVLYPIMNSVNVRDAERKRI